MENKMIGNIFYDNRNVIKAVSEEIEKETGVKLTIVDLLPKVLVKLGIKNGDIKAEEQLKEFIAWTNRRHEKGKGIYED